MNLEILLLDGHRCCHGAGRLVDVDKDLGLHGFLDGSDGHLLAGHRFVGDGSRRLFNVFDFHRFGALPQLRFRGGASSDLVAASDFLRNVEVSESIGATLSLASAVGRHCISGDQLALAHWT